MGYASYILPDGREAGYAVDATCDEAGCAAEIDRGLAYLCGNTPGGDEYGCGDYFCGAHLHFQWAEGVPSLCQRCSDAYELDHPVQQPTDATL
jgi:hypothetical protein